MVGEEPSRFFTRSIERISSDSSTASKGLGPLSNQSAPVWRFAILGGRTTGDSSAGVLANDTKRDWEWGLENESAKIHIPSLLRWNQAQPGIARSFLLTLPEADEDMVDAWLSMLGVKSPNMEARDAIQSAPAGLASNLIREQEQKALDRVRLRWLGGDLDQNYQVDPWEESLLEKLLFDPQGASPAQAKKIGRAHV